MKMNDTTANKQTKPLTFRDIDAGSSFRVGPLGRYLYIKVHRDSIMSCLGYSGFLAVNLSNGNMTEIDPERKVFDVNVHTVVRD